MNPLRPTLILLATLSTGSLVMPAAADGQAPSTSTDAALAHARALLRSTPLIDGHNDLPWEIRRAQGHPLDVAAYDLRQPAPKHTDLARLKEAAQDQRTLLRLRLHSVLAQIELSEVAWGSGHVDGDAAPAVGWLEASLGALGPQPVDHALDEVPVEPADERGVPLGQGVERAVAELDAGPAALA